MTSQSDSELKELLFRAFSSRIRPAAEQLVRPAVSQYDSIHVRELLAAKTPKELTPHDLKTILEGNLWMLSPEAFLYFLPAFLYESMISYETLSVFASELIGALTEPSRDDIVNDIDSLAQNQSELGLPDDITDVLRSQQLEWFDSGVPTAIFRERFDHLRHEEGAAVLAFLKAFQQAHGADFPFDELDTAIKRHWSRYHTS